MNVTIYMKEFEISEYKHHDCNAWNNIKCYLLFVGGMIWSKYRSMVIVYDNLNLFTAAVERQAQRGLVV